MDIADHSDIAPFECARKLQSLEHARRAREAAARSYMLALGASIAAGEPMDELAADHGSLTAGGTQLLALCRPNADTALVTP